MGQKAGRNTRGSNVVGEGTKRKIRSRKRPGPRWVSVEYDVRRWVLHDQVEVTYHMQAGQALVRDTLVQTHYELKVVLRDGNRLVGLRFLAPGFRTSHSRSSRLSSSAGGAGALAACQLVAPFEPIGVPLVQDIGVPSGEDLALQILEGLRGLGE